MSEREESGSGTADWVAQTTKKRRGLEERQPHDIGVRSGQIADEHRRAALNRVAARLPVPLFFGEIGVDLLLLQALETNERGHHPLRHTSIRTDDTDTAVDPVSPAGQLPQTPIRALGINGLGQDPTSARHHRIGANDKRLRSSTGNRQCLGGRQARSQSARQFTTERRLVDICGNNFVRLDADLTKECKPAGRCGCEDEPRTHGLAAMFRPELILPMVDYL